MTIYLARAFGDRMIEVQGGRDIPVSLHINDRNGSAFAKLGDGEALDVAVALLSYVKDQGLGVQQQRSSAVSLTDNMISAVDVLLNIVAKRRDRPGFKDNF